MAKVDASPQESLGEILRLAKDYAIQETVDPIRGLWKFIAYGVAAALVGSIAVSLIMLGILRMIQRESGVHLTGSLTWVPYLVTLVLSTSMVAVALRAISSKKGKKS